MGPMTILPLLILTALFPCARAEDAIVFPPPPRLATTAAELDALKKTPEFETLRQQKAKEADALLARPVIVPDQAGQWMFYYACPTHGTTLVAFKPPEQHQCPACKKIYSDERTVGAYRGILHMAAERAAQTLGEAYAYTGDERYVAEVKRILLKYADNYHTYPGRRDRWGRPGWFAPLGGRRYDQSLDEAVGAVRLAKAYDLTRNSPAWSGKEQTHVEQDFFRPTAETLLRFNQDINNHQTWYNAGLLAIASVLGDAELVRKVLTMKGGFHDQLKRSVTSDGLWYEGTMAYHNYALQAMIEIVDAGRRLGLPLHQEAAFRSMLEAPLKAAYPNGQFPAINDSDPSNIQSFAGMFLWAWQTYHDPLFAQAYACGSPAKLRKLTGADGPATPTLEMRSVDLSGAGLAVLRQGRGAEAASVFLDYGLHGEGHGHPDKLNITLYAMGREWLLDPGRIGYSHAEYKTWCRQTVAHNTVVLDGQSQTPTTGRLLWLRAEDDFAACAAESDGAYPGSVLRRHLFLSKNMLVDVFEVESAQAHQIDWLAHAISDRLEPADERGAGEAAPAGDENGYQYLRDSRCWKATGGSKWDFKASDGKRLRLWLAAAVNETLFASVGVGYQPRQRAPCLLRRRKGNAARFVTAYDLTGTGDLIRSVQGEENRPVVRVETKEGNWRINFSQDAQAFAVEAPPK